MVTEFSSIFSHSRNAAINRQLLAVTSCFVWTNHELIRLFTDKLIVGLISELIGAIPYVFRCFFVSLLPVVFLLKHSQENVALETARAILRSSGFLVRCFASSIWNTLWNTTRSNYLCKINKSGGGGRGRRWRREEKEKKISYIDTISGHVFHDNIIDSINKWNVQHWPSRDEIRWSNKANGMPSLSFRLLENRS